MDIIVIHISKAYSLEKLCCFICTQTNLHSEHNGVWPVVYLSCVHFWKPVVSGLYSIMYTFLKVRVFRISQWCNWCCCSGIFCPVSGWLMHKILKQLIMFPSSGVKCPMKRLETSGINPQCCCTISQKNGDLISEISWRKFLYLRNTSCHSIVC
jgi:hypothetical protein